MRYDARDAQPALHTRVCEGGVQRPAEAEVWGTRVCRGVVDCAARLLRSDRLMMMRVI